VSKGKLFVISGASGVGKGTVLNLVMQKREDLSFSVSATTREPRPGEQDGVHYYFVTKERFEQMIAQGEFLEYDAHAKNYYGTPRSQMEDKLSHGHVLLDIEPNGARAVKESAPEATLIFIMPPSIQELERRLRGRGDTPEDQICVRMERAVWEMEQRRWYDYVVVNDDADACAEEILHIIAEKAKN
jgi:guanylate kinase